MKSEVNRTARHARNIAHPAIAVITCLLLTFVSAPAKAFDFEGFCPTQAPPNWSGAAWSQFRSSCISNDAAARAGRRSDRGLWDQCLKTCGLADQAEGVKPTLAPPKLHSGPGEPPLNPNWCSDVPASPPPPRFETYPGTWAEVRNQCTNAVPANMECIGICEGARELWAAYNSPAPVATPWNSTGSPQGPFPLPGGG
jgi:hypothetical protein